MTYCTIFMFGWEGRVPMISYANDLLGLVSIREDEQIVGQVL